MKNILYSFRSDGLYFDFLLKETKADEFISFDLEVAYLKKRCNNNAFKNRVILFKECIRSFLNKYGSNFANIEHL